MKKLCISMLLLAIVILPTNGCMSPGGANTNWQANVPQLKSDIFMFSKFATRVALTEAEMPAADVALVQGYLTALRDLLAVPGQPNFAGARALVNSKLPPKYKVYGFTIIDVIERYVSTADLGVTADQELIITIISSGIDGAMEAVEEFAV